MCVILASFTLGQSRLHAVPFFSRAAVYLAHSSLARGRRISLAPVPQSVREKKGTACSLGEILANLLIATATFMRLGTKSAHTHDIHILAVSKKQLACYERRTVTPA